MGKERVICDNCTKLRLCYKSNKRAVHMAIFTDRCEKYENIYQSVLNKLK